jgi:acyl carrier protein phosphodiesterase
MLRGMAQHQKIDAFTDSHELVRQSRARIPAPYRRYSGIIVDIFYDHFLAAHWADYEAVPVEAFTQHVYTAVRGHDHLLPPPARTMLAAIREHDLLLACQDREGVETTLRRVAMRLERRSGRPIEMAGAIVFLDTEFAGLSADFQYFFPALQAYAQGLLIPSPSGRGLG